MNCIGSKTKCALALAVAGMLAIGPAMAEKPSWAGGGKPDREERSNQRDNQRHDQKGDQRDNRKGERRDSDRQSSRDHFDSRHRVMVRDYYGQRYSAGRCPPGLAKKHNGCMPPGQAKKWQIGQRLQRDVIYYSVPQQLVVQIGQPPAGYRYVRVASDILMMAIGTGMIVDAIQDLGRS
jgi:Ni/Co efflux regulator RcnB